jgi:conjugal transfer pilus assembly protein TraU
MAIGAETGSGICQSAGVWKGLIKNICWSCIFPMRIMGVGSSPEGAAPSQPVCFCTDQNGVPEVGWQLSFFQPVKIVGCTVTMVFTIPEGVSLQSSSFDMGKGATNKPKGVTRQGFMMFTYGSFRSWSCLSSSLWGIVRQSHILTRL